MPTDDALISIDITDTPFTSALHEPPMTAVPVGDVDADDVRTILEERGRVRLSELADELHTNRPTLYHAIMTLVEDGDAAIFPIGDVVQVRYES
jgi:hypothetical protein